MKRDCENEGRKQHNVQYLASARVGKFVNAICCSCFVFLSHIAIAILATFVVGWFFEGTILHIFFKLGVKNLKLWHVAVVLSFVSSFWGTVQINKEGSDIAFLNIRDSLIISIKAVINYGLHIIFNPFFGALYGLLIGIFFKNAIISTIEKIGLTNVMPWELGVFAGFIGAFFVHVVKKS